MHVSKIYTPELRSWTSFQHSKLQNIISTDRQPSEDANRFDDLVSAARSVPGVKPGHAARVAEAIASSSPAVVDRSAAGSTADSGEKTDLG